MMTVKIDAAVWKRKTDKLTKNVIVGIGTDVRTAARVVAATMATHTLPFGHGSERPETFMVVVEGDVKRAQVMQDELGLAYEEFKKQDESLAKLLWHAIKSGKKSLQRRLIEDLTIAAGMTRGKVDKAVHEKARTTKKKGVPKKHVPRHIITSGGKSALDSFAKRKQKRIGYAKAGWAAAAKSLGGAVSKREGFQAWYNTGQHKDARGASNVDGKASSLVITLVNQVPYIQAALPPSLYQMALSKIERNVATAIAKKIKARTKKAMT
jgi:hypothetical protein